MILSVIITFPLAYSVNLGDEWNSIKNSLSDGEKTEVVSDALSYLSKAVSTYENSFKDTALEVDPESNQIIEAAFEDITDNLNSGDVEMASLNRQAIDKTIYKIAFMKMESAVDEDNVDDFVSWYSVLEKKFNVPEKDYQTNKWIAEIKSDELTLSEYGPAILDEMLNIFKIKTFEEIEEAIFALAEGDIKSAKKFTYEGLYYYRTFHPAVEAKLGVDTANKLLHEMEEAIEIAMSKKSPEEMKSEIEHIAAEVELIIRDYEGGDTSAIGLALSGIKDRLKLVDVEYVDAVADGQIINQEEYDETVAFLAKAISLFETVESDLITLSESDAKGIKSNLAEIDSIVTSLGNPSKITVLVAKSINHLVSLEEYSGGAVEVDIFTYFDEIERLLEEARIEYRNGNAQLAHDLVSKAYLDNYEFVEGPLGEVDPELMFKIEIDMREDLRNMIQNNKSPDMVDEQIDMILIDLASAKKVVPEFGTIALMIFVISLVAITMLSSKSKLNILPKI
ncbi:MAG: PEFG-CTERM sorting domain-containing protein [Nitrosopumilus sp.]|nr:PEFG-CTERM sorting domain-containing protein [Nitrosopumilus sp.]